MVVAAAVSGQQPCPSRTVHVPHGWRDEDPVGGVYGRPFYCPGVEAPPTDRAWLDPEKAWPYRPPPAEYGPDPAGIQIPWFGLGILLAVLAGLVIGYLL